MGRKPSSKSGWTVPCFPPFSRSSTSRPLARRCRRQDFIDDQRIELFRIEFATDPFDHLLVLGMLRVADRRQEIRISPDAAAIVGRTGALAADADRNRQTFGSVENFFNDHLMLPAVAEVVQIQHRLLLAA